MASVICACMPLLYKIEPQSEAPAFCSCIPRLQLSYHSLAIDRSPEIELLCCYADTQIPPEESQHSRYLLKDAIDWPLLLSTASRHGMFPLLAWHLARLRPGVAPAPILQHVQDEFQRHGRENLRLIATLVRVLHSLTQRGLTAIPFKGPVQALLLYGNVALRQFSDLDLFIHLEDLVPVQDVLRSHGFQPDIELDQQKQMAHVRHGCEMQFTSAKEGICIDLHWAFTPRHFSLGTIQDLWERTCTLTVAGEQVCTFAPEDLLLVLCIHGYKHYWERLSWLCDVAMLIRTYPQINFGDALERASAMGARRIVLLALRLANDILALRLPEDVSSLIAAEPELGRLAAMATPRIFAVAPQADGDVARWRFVLAVRERWSDKLVCAGRFLFTPTREDWQSLRLPRVLSCLYPAVRVLRIAGRLLGLLPAQPVSAKPHWPVDQQWQIPGQPL